MPNLSIPGAVAENPKITPCAKLAYGVTFKKLGGGERPNVGLADLGNPCGATQEDLIAAVRNLADNGYARVDETVSKLEDVVFDQQVRLTGHLFIEVLPRIPVDEDSVTTRRYGGKDEIFWDEEQIGRNIYRASVGSFMGQYLMTITLRNDLGIRTIAEAMPHETLGKSWSWFDDYMDEQRRLFTETGKIQIPPETMKSEPDAATAPSDAHPLVEWLKQFATTRLQTANPLADILIDEDTFDLGRSLVDDYHASIEDDLEEDMPVGGEKMGSFGFIVPDAGCVVFSFSEEGSRWEGLDSEPEQSRATDPALVVTEEEEFLVAKIAAILPSRATVSRAGLQEEFKIGGERAARVLQILEARGLVGPGVSGKSRKVLVGA